MTDSPEAGRTKNNAPVQIMLVEDNPGDVHLLELSLRSRNIVFDLILYKDGAQVIRAISESHLVVPAVGSAVTGTGAPPGAAARGCPRGSPHSVRHFKRPAICGSHGSGEIHSQASEA